MSTLAKQIIGEDEDQELFRRLAQVALRPDKLKMAKIKKAFEELGADEVGVDMYQSHYPWVRVSAYGAVANMDIWKGGIDDTMKALFNEAMNKAGCSEDVQGAMSYSAGGPSFKMTFNMKKYGPFNGTLNPDGRFIRRVGPYSLDQ